MPHNLTSALAATAALTLTIPVFATGSAENGLKACAVIGDAGARLSCYDKLAAPLPPRKSPAAAAKPAAPAKSAPVTPVRTATTTTPTAPQAQKTPAQFGSEQLPAAETQSGKTSGPIDHISSEVTDVAYSLRKRFTVFLANGQIWKQSPSDAVQAYFPRHGEITVTITRGLVGGYNLTINDSDKVYKVDRVK